MINLLAACRTSNGLVVKRVRIAQGVQHELSGIFAAQSAEFFEGINEEVDFTGSWTPDPDELLVTPTPPDAQPVVDAAAANPSTLADIDTAHFEQERIVALFVVQTQDGGNPKILLQPFSAQQVLNRKISLMLSSGVFNKLTEPAFTLSTKLVGVIEGGLLKFKSFSNIRRIFDILHLYTEATDEQIDKFCSHDRVHVADPIAFKSAADQTVRKLIHAISKSETLSRNEPVDIVAKAASLGIVVEMKEGKIEFPPDRKILKTLCLFLDNAIYEGALDSLRYQANSKRPMV